jgi:phosphoribosylformylglycinamidine cyclo-ligase
VRPLLALLAEIPVHGIAHITGGGPSGNIPRVIPDGLEAVIDPRRWRRQPVFDWLQRAGNVATAEMHRTFNCGLGMTICVAAADAARAVEILTAAGEEATLIGEVRRGNGGVVVAA